MISFVFSCILMLTFGRRMKVFCPLLDHHEEEHQDELGFDRDPPYQQSRRYCRPDWRVQPAN